MILYFDYYLVLISRLMHRSLTFLGWILALLGRIFCKKFIFWSSFHLNLLRRLPRISFFAEKKTLEFILSMSWKKQGSVRNPNFTIKWNLEVCQNLTYFALIQEFVSRPRFEHHTEAKSVLKYSPIWTIPVHIMY